MSLLPPEESRAYGWFGYQGAMCDRAIQADNGPMLQECIDRVFIDTAAEGDRIGIDVTVCRDGSDFKQASANLEGATRQTQGLFA